LRAFLAVQSDHAVCGWKALRPFEHDGARLREPCGERLVGDDTCRDGIRSSAPARGDLAVFEDLPLAFGGSVARRGESEHLRVQAFTNERELSHEQRAIAQIAGSKGTLRVKLGTADRFAHSNPTAAVPICPARDLAQAIGGLVAGRDHERLLADGHARERIVNALGRERRDLLDHRRRMKAHVTRQERAHVRREAAGAHLRERVMPSIGQHHVVARLRAAVEAHDDVGSRLPHEVIGGEPLARIAEAEIDDGERAELSPASP
jgi:hypothetical protein